MVAKTISWSSTLSLMRKFSACFISIRLLLSENIPIWLWEIVSDFPTKDNPWGPL